MSVLNKLCRGGRRTTLARSAQSGLRPAERTASSNKNDGNDDHQSIDTDTGHCRFPSRNDLDY